MTTTKISEKDAEKLIIELAKQGTTAEKIGQILKNDHGVSKTKTLLNKKISQILRENNLYISPDKKNLSDQVEKLKKHLGKNRLDHTTRRILLIQEAKLRKLVKMGY
jgi:small subunit ribosomal protein S15